MKNLKIIVSMMKMNSFKKLLLYVLGPYTQPRYYQRGLARSFIFGWHKLNIRLVSL